jgi:cold shock protein
VRPARRGCLPSMNTERINMPKGFLKTYLIDRGFGFIRPGEGGRDIFFYYRDLDANPDDLRTGDALQFELATGRDGRPIATRVRWAT